MAKMYGLFGSMTGKVANVVMAVRFGEQIARKYQPIVSNPKSEGQVASRAKLKMLSQLAAVMASVIAIARNGAKSSRNLFIQKNYASASYNDNEANINLLDIQLTNGILAMQNLSVTRDGANLTISVAQQYETVFDHVVYAVFSMRSDNRLLFEKSAVVSTPGANNTFETNVLIESDSLDVIVYAYGVRDNTEAARVLFGNLETLTAAQVAKVIVSRTLTDADITVSRTVAAFSTPSA